MKEEFQTEDEISLLDIIRTLFERIKLLIIIVLVGGVIGGSIAVASTINVNYWGATVEFYVNPESSETESGENSSQYGVYGAYGRHVMDNMVKLLSSESFAEKLILNNKPLPEKSVWVDTSNADEVALELDAKIDAAATVIAEEDAQRATVVLEKNAYELAIDEYETAYKQIETEWSKLPLKSLGLSAKFNKEEYILHIYGNNYTDMEAAYNAVYDSISGKEAAKMKAKENYEAAIVLLKEKESLSQEITEIALEAWRKTAKYKAQLSQYSGAVSYSYLQEQEDLEDANNLARSFIYVQISVLNDTDFANEVLKRVKAVVPQYVRENMTVPAGYVGTKCQRITRTDDIALTNPGYTRDEAIKWTILSAIIVGLIASVIVIIVDRSDKRLKECDVLTKKFDLPILGIIPTIEAITGEVNTKEAKK